MTIGPILAAQAGLITRSQALAAGLPATAIDERVRLRRWRPVLPSVYLVGDPRATPAEVAARAALLWAGPDALLVGLSAAWWHGLAADAPAQVRVAVPRRRRLLRRTDVLLAGRPTLRVADVVEVRGVRVTAPALSMLDAAVELGDGGTALLAAGMRAGVSEAELVAVLQRAAGRSGAGRLLRELRHKVTSGAGCGCHLHDRCCRWTR